MYGYSKRCWSIVFAVVCSILLSACSSKGTDGGDEDDGNNPYYIADLSISASTDSSITLIWTATGDDADAGTASSYDLRYWHTWIVDANWDSVFQVQGEPHPAPAGQQDSMCVPGLQKDSTYYFALRVFDEVGNVAGSNNAHGMCFCDAVVHFTDVRLDSAVRALVARPSGDILRSHLMGIELFFANHAGISDLSGIEPWTSLRGVSLTGNQVTDLAPLAALPKLEFLGLSSTGLVDISQLGNMPRLEVIQLRANAVVDLGPLAGLTHVHVLDLTQNQIAGLAPLAANADFAAGDTLHVGFNPLSQESIQVTVPALQLRGVTVLGI